MGKFCGKISEAHSSAQFRAETMAVTCTLHSACCLWFFLLYFELQGIELDINVVGVIPWRTPVGATPDSQQPYAWQSHWILKSADANFTSLKARLEKQFVLPHLETSPIELGGLEIGPKM